MSEQTPRRRRADRVYTPEENEAAPCRRRMNADAPPRRRRTREYYSPEEFIPYPAEDSFDTMPPDIPFDVPPNTPSAPPKRKFRLPPLGESLRRTMQLLRSARPDFPFRRPHGVGDLLNMLLDVLLWLPKLTAHLTLYAYRYLRASVRYAVEGATPLWQAFLLRPYSWAGFYLLLGGLAFGGVHLMSRGSTGASFAGFVLLLAPLAWGIVLGWAAANALHRHCFFSRWTFVALEVLCAIGIAGAALGYPIALLASAPLPLWMLTGALLLRRTTLQSFSPAAIVDFFQRLKPRWELRRIGLHTAATVSYTAPVKRNRFFIELQCTHPSTGNALILFHTSTIEPALGQKVHVILHPTEEDIYEVDLTTSIPRVKIRKNDLWRNRE